MDALLSTLVQSDPEPFDCIVHIGPGAYARLEDYASLEARHLLLVEADPAASEVLAERFHGSDSVTVIEALVAAQEGPTTFHRYNLPLLNSPLGLGRIREFYPRVELVDSLPMQATTLSSLITRRASLLGARNLLILDIPGQEASLASTMDSQLAARFPWILVFGANQPCQDGGASFEETLVALGKLFYEIHGQLTDDPDWPLLLFHCDSVKAGKQAELDNMAALLCAKEAQSGQQAIDIKNLEAQLQHLTSSHSQVLAERDLLLGERDSLASRILSLTAEKAALDARVSSLAAERNELATRQQAVVVERDALAAERNELATRQQAVVVERDALAAERNELATRHQAVVVERDALAAERNELATRHQAVVAERNELATRCSHLESERVNISNSLIDNQNQLKTERRIVESLANSIHNNTQSFREITLALTTGIADLPRSESPKLSTSKSAQPTNPQLQSHTFEFLDKNESKALNSFLESIRVG